jgi:hypothetical protein
MTARVAYNRTLLTSNDVALFSYPTSLNLFLPGYMPSVGFTGADGIGPGTQNLVGRVQNLYDFQENVQYIRASHSMKFGGDITHIGFNKHGEASGLNGALSWATLQDFLLDNRLQSFSAAAIGSDTYRSYVQYIYATYFQDDWKITPKLTWNLGVRYEPFTSPTEKHGRESMLKDWAHDTAFSTTIGLFKNPSLKNISPRVGVAWDPQGNGETAIRAGFGLFYVDILNPYYATPGQKDAPFFGSTASVLGNLASAVSDMARINASLLSAVMNPNTFMELTQWNLNTSYEIKANLTVVRQLPGNMVLSVGYLGDRGIHLWRNSDVNDSPFTIVNGREFIPNGTPRVNPNTGVGTTRYSDAQSFYNALQTELKKSFGHGLQFQASYTWSKNVDDATTGVANTDFNEGVSSQAYNPKVDRGPSALNQTQNLVINGVYQIPAAVKTGAASYLVNGWQVSTIFSAATGSPFSPRVSGRNAPDQSRSAGGQRPDIAPGRSYGSMVIGDPNQYFDPTSFILPPVGFFGIAGRNIITGPGLENFDLSLAKMTPLGIREGARLEFRAEFFNLINRANFAVPSSLSVVNPSTPSNPYVAGAGLITKTVTSARQMQFGLKVVF